MTAKSLTTVATLFADPSNTTIALNESAIFSLKLDDTVQTLSKQKAPDKGSIQGLLFVPSLGTQDPCNNATEPYIPANVTRLQGVTPFDGRVIGLAPWISDECSQAFLDVSQGTVPDALLFFLPSNDDTKPPSANDPAWQLGGSTNWQSQSNFPVYGIPGAAGATLMEQLSRDGSVPNPDDPDNLTPLSSLGASRLFAVIDIDSGGKKMPSIWGFILAILGTVLVLTIILLLFYQLVHRRHQRELQRRLEAGEADLEQLAQLHIKVPPEFLETMPIYIYMGGGDDDESINENSTPGHLPRVTEHAAEDKDPKNPTVAIRETDDEAEKAIDGESIRRPSQATIAGQPDAYVQHKNRLSRQQTTCAICLDDFERDLSAVRELPCGHIYHPPCIDTSLTQSSSLCPLCKKSVLPSSWFRFPPEDPWLQPH
ncbi:RING-H2 finger protein [Aspergillus luchuensis]|uniref:Uncharacterized protein n=1 Tax=Aspergillus kawachii TaxID=1069201 RepID=A0A7R7WSL7_ASPKA|nr:uncharacterized protein AKAW2_20515A [Aspergillus luchuensis]BCR95576.1 hypothetical protein AKAW2_20515A [Aspergillus luchuensis]BCS08115.1 hypothetical protein ALUC_20485A [Aspergillus luchuensis]GAA88703.1 RING finger domain protein [Aspergillus luchuensis IFO 4308]